MTLEFDEGAISTKINKAMDKTQFILDQQVIKDSNLYCPEDRGGLQDSAIIGQQLGVVVWDIEYAKRQYYEDNNKSKDLNPRASMKWFEVAKAEYKKEWLKLAKSEYKEAMK